MTAVHYWTDGMHIWIKLANIFQQLRNSHCNKTDIDVNLMFAQIMIHCN